MVSYHPRSSWTTRPMSNPRQVKPYAFAAVHWPGLSGQLGLDTHPKCLDLLRTLERNAVAGSYDAIPYQVAACAHGLTEGRTVGQVNAANGDTQTNLDGGSVVVLIGTADAVTDAHKRNVRAALAYLHAPVLKTHNDVRPSPTACPGPDLTKWIHAGAPIPAPTPPKGDTVRYLSLATDTAKPLSLPAGKWTLIQWPKESSDDWNGHADGYGRIDLPAGGIVSGGVNLTLDVAAECRVTRGPKDGSKPPTTIAATEDGPGPFVLSIAPALSQDSLWVEVRPAVPGKVLVGALRLVVQDRAK